MASYESLTDFPTINEERADVLRSVGIATPKDVATVPLEELVNIDGLPRPLAERIHDTATEQFGDLTPEFDESVEEPYQFYLATPYPEFTGVMDYLILIGPSLNATADNDWAVYRTTDGGARIPVGSRLYVFNDGNPVAINGEMFTLSVAQLIANRSVDENEWDGRFLEVPAELQGRSYPEVNTVSDDALKLMMFSVTGEEVLEAKRSQ